MKLLALLCTIAVSASTFAAPQIESTTSVSRPLPDGWNAARWGMSAGDLTKLYPTIQQCQEATTFGIGGRDYLSRLSLPSVAVGQDTFTARFLMGSSGTLAAVQLFCPRDSPEKTKATYERIKSALTQKYSAPARDGEFVPDARMLDKTSKQTTWENAGSRITLEYISVDAQNDPYVIIWYLKLDPTQSAGKDANL